ncbi:unnamed protein product [Ectocarpus sp. 12 AP-2014]
MPAFQKIAPPKEDLLEDQAAALQQSPRTQPRPRAVKVRNGERLFPAGTADSPPMLFPCHQQHQVVSEVALLLPRVRTLDLAFVRSFILAVNRLEKPPGATAAVGR